MRQLTLLLPERRRFAGQPLAPDTALRLGRADRERTPPGEQHQLQRHFQASPAGWPMAAISRDAARGDAADAVWLRADPAFVRAEISGARLMGWGNLALDAQGSKAMLEAVRAVFQDQGWQLSALSPDRWCVRLPPDARVPPFVAPGDALGEDLLAHLPEGDAGRLWRQVITETQVILHNHAHNLVRLSAGQPPVNSLWFWGAGRLPTALNTRAHAVMTADEDLGALAQCARANLAAGTDEWSDLAGNVLLDLRHERDWQSVEHIVQAGLHAVANGGLLLDFADGTRLVLRDNQRWRFWRRPVTALEAS